MAHIVAIHQTMPGSSEYLVTYVVGLFQRSLLQEAGCAQSVSS